LALVAVLVAKSSTTSTALGAFFGMLNGLVKNIMGPLNAGAH
jgi:hypothetical protein